MPVIQYSIPNPGGGQVDFGADEPVDDYTYYQLLLEAGYENHFVRYIRINLHFVIL